MRRDESGQVTAFLVVIISALILLAGLVVDGGVILAANRKAGAEAEAAARAGASVYDTGRYRAGGPLVLDPSGAERAAQDYIGQTGHGGSARVTGPDTVEAEVSFSQPLVILGIIGIGPVSIHGQGTARSRVGVSAPDDIR
jgi:hypothetical protein